MYEKSISEIRRENLNFILKSYTSKKEFSLEMGMSSSHLSILTSPKKRSNIGDKTAQKIEKVSGKPQGWLDIDHNSNDGLPFDVDLILDAIDALDEALSEVGKSRSFLKGNAYKEMLRAIIVRSYNDNEITITSAKNYLVSAQIESVTY